MTPAWTLAERRAALVRAERDGVDVLVIGGGIVGAGVVRDAASRGLSALLVEKADFASGTSSRSSKMVHGGLRYLAHGHLGITREACRERDSLLALNPNLVKPLPFLFCAFEGGKVKAWQVRAALAVYWGLASFRSSAGYRMLDHDEVSAYSRDFRQDGLLAAGLYHDAQVDDARLVVEALKHARSLGGDAVGNAEAIEFLREPGGALCGARVRDLLGGRTFQIRAAAVVNAAGPAIERVRGLDHPSTQRHIRPAKGVHIAIPRDRVHAEGAVSFEAADGRHLFLCPFGDVAMIGTTDTFTDRIEEPVVTIDEVHYLLAAANDAFPNAGLTTNDIRSVWAGVRPLVADGEDETPPSDVSRESEIDESASGLVSVAGGKLTTFRAMGEAAMDIVVRRLPPERRRAAGPSRTAGLPLREDAFARADVERELARKYELPAPIVDRLITAWGADAVSLVADAPAELRKPIGATRYLLAEIPWAIRHECPATLCDVLERRVRLALFAPGQGLPQLAQIAQVAAEAAGWDAERTRAEATAYAASVRRRYQIVPRAEAGRAA